MSWVPAQPGGLIFCPVPVLIFAAAAKYASADRDHRLASRPAPSKITPQSAQQRERKGLPFKTCSFKIESVKPMGEFLKSECPHCGQAIEYPAEGTGQTVPCPTCAEPFVLKPVIEPPPEIVVPPPAPPIPAPILSGLPIAAPSAPATPPMPAQSAPPAAPATKPILPAPVAPAPLPRPTATPASRAKHSSESLGGRLDQACREFASAREFEKLQPTREQIARALVAANFNRTTEAQWPTHAELVAALKKLFPEFRSRPTVIKPITPDKK